MSSSPLTPGEPGSASGEGSGVETFEMLRLALDSAGLGWWHVDLTTGKISWNDRFQQLAGLPDGFTMDYQSSLALVHPEDVQRVDAAIQAATRAVDPEPYAMDYRTLHADGSYHWLHSRGQAYYEGEGQNRRATRFVGTVADIDDRKQAEEALRQSEVRYQSLVNSVDSGFCVFRMLFDAAGKPVDYRFLQVNPAFEGQTGLKDAVGKTARELVPDLEDEWMELYGRVATTGEPARFNQGSDAMERWFDVYAFRLGGDESRDVALLFTDITNQKAVESSLRAAHERATGILESITDGFYSLDSDWRFSYVNREAERLLDRTDLVGKVLWVEYPGFENTEFGRAYLRAASEGISSAVTSYYPDHDRWYEVHSGPSPEGVAVYFRDVSERERNEREREGLLQQVQAERSKLDLAHAGSFGFVAILTGRDLVFDYANAPYYQLVGHREIIGKPLAEALPEVVDQGFPDLLLGVMDSGEPFEISEMTVMLQREPNGPFEQRFVSLRYLPMSEPDGSITGVYAHGIDVTETVHARRTLAARAEETALGSRRKDEFLATLAHELRNPLAPIRLSTELMEMLEPDDPEFKEAQTVIRRQVDHMVRLVDDLLDVSRVAQGKIKLRRETTDVAKVVEAAVETSRPLIEAGDHDFRIVSPAEPIYVHGDATRLAQVLANLLNNSAKYTPRGGEISLQVEREGDEAVLRVADTGIGISNEMLPHVFDMFAQAEVQMSQAQGGLGIGLTLSRRLMEKHGGTIEARSGGSGQGSEFVVRLPAVPSPAEAATIAATATTPFRSRRVLVVDDNIDNAWTLSGLLETMGHDVRVAHTGEEGLAAAELFRPEVVLLDLGLPDLPGYEVARRLRGDARFARAHLVAQTGWGREEDRALGREAGFDAHLVKPLSRADLNRLFSGLSA